MAETEKDLVVKMGLETNEVNNGLDSVTSKVSAASQKMATSLNSTTEAAKKLGTQLEKAGKAAGGIMINKNALVTSGIMVGTMAARGIFSSMEDKAIGQSFSTVSTHAGVGAAAGMQIGGPWGAAIGGLTGAATGLFSAANAIKKSMEEAEKMFVENRLNNAKTVDAFFDKIKAQTAEKQFANKMNDPNVSADDKRAILTQRERGAIANLNESSRLLKSDAVLSGDASTIETYKQRIVDDLAKLKEVNKLREQINKEEEETAERRDKIMDMLRKSLAEKPSKKDGKIDTPNLTRSDSASLATNELTRVGLGVNGLNNLPAVQLKTNELVRRSNELLASIDAKTGGTTTWA